MKPMKKAARQLQGYGRYGDSVLAHISPEEAHWLKQRGGAGTRNPLSGLLEFWGAGDDSLGGDDEGGDISGGEGSDTIGGDGPGAGSDGLGGSDDTGGDGGGTFSGGWGSDTLNAGPRSTPPTGAPQEDTFSEAVRTAKGIANMINPLGFPGNPAGIGPLDPLVGALTGVEPMPFQEGIFGRLNDLWGRVENEYPGSVDRSPGAYPDRNPDGQSDYTPPQVTTDPNDGPITSDPAATDTAPGQPTWTYTPPTMSFDEWRRYAYGAAAPFFGLRPGPPSGRAG